MQASEEVGGRAPEALRREGLARVVAVACAAAALGAGVTACGGDDPEQQVRDVVRRAQDAFAAERLGEVCETLTAAARAHIRSIGHESSGTCARDLITIYQGVTNPDPVTGRPRRRQPRREIVSVDVRGDRAVAVVRFGPGMTGDLPLRREDGEWRIDGLYGGMPAGLQEDKF